MTRTCATLSELVACCGGAVRTGPFGSQLHKHDYVEYVDATPVIMPKDMVEGRVDTSSIARVDDATIDRLKQHVLKDGDIVLARRGEIGRRAWIGDREAGWLCGTGSMRVSLRDCPRVRSRYLYYYLETEPAIGWLQGHSVGATMSNLSAGVVEQLPVEFPSIEVQDKVIGILDSIELLIDNNRRRIQLLEEGARRVYREWFIDYRFPRDGLVTTVDSPVGPVPEHWEVAVVGDVVDTVGGGTPARDRADYWAEPTIEWYTPSDLTKRPAMFAFRSGDRINEVGLAKSSAKLFPARTVMLTSRATIGEVSIATTPAATNQGFISCVPNSRMSEYHLYFWLKENVSLFLTLSGGATFKELRKSTFRQLPIALPPEDVETQFNDVVGPIGGLIENLLRQNGALLETRALLLPRLVSGNLDASDPVDLVPVA